MPSIYFENSYKLASLDQSELGTLLIGYLTFHPKETMASLKLSVLDKKFKTLAIGGKRYGSTAGSRLFPYARIIALWWNNNGIVNPGMMRPGIICFFIIHRVEIKGRQNIHVFALVDWLKSTLVTEIPCFFCLFGLLKTLRMLDQQLSCPSREFTQSVYLY